MGLKLNKYTAKDKIVWILIVAFMFCIGALVTVITIAIKLVDAIVRNFK